MLSRFMGWFLTVSLYWLYPITFVQSAEDLDRVLLQLSGPERTAIQEGKVVVVGESGSYRGRLLVASSIDKAWEVLTDYDNFEQFLPNTIESEVLEINGNQQIFEQTNFGSLLFFSKTIKVKVLATENEPYTISFSLIEGDIKELEGQWQIQEVVENGEVNQVLITYTVQVEPDGSVPSGVFYSLYKDGIQEILEAIKREIERREEA